MRRQHVRVVGRSAVGAVVLLLPLVVVAGPVPMLLRRRRVIIDRGKWKERVSWWGGALGMAGHSQTGRLVTMKPPVPLPLSMPSFEGGG